MDSEFFRKYQVSVNVRRPAGATQGVGQGVWWVDRHGRWLRVSEMSLNHIENVMQRLKDSASTYARYEVARMDVIMHDVPDGAWNHFTAQASWIAANPVKWMKTTPLYQSLKARRKFLRKEAKRAVRQSGQQ